MAFTKRPIKTKYEYKWQAKINKTNTIKCHSLIHSFFHSIIDPLKLFLFLFYNLNKALAKISFKLFYEKVDIKNRLRLRTDNPCILVSNHPSTMTDPINVAHEAKRIVHFLANGSLFKSPFGHWFFNTFYCIPIYRPEDVDGKRIDNGDSFERADEFLMGGGLLYVAPEGYSQKERRLGKIKTGTARIALSAASKTDFKLGLTIQPTGLNYSAHTDFRSKLFTYVGPVAIKVADYQQAYEKDPREAAIEMTNDLTEAMRKLIIDTEDQAEDELLLQLEELSHNENPLSLEDNFFRNKKILDQLRIYKSNFPSDDKAFRQKVKQYFETLEENKLQDFALAEETSQKVPSTLIQGLQLFLSLPFFLYGWINNFFANFLPAALEKKLGLYKGYTSTVKVMSAVVIYPLVYGIQIWLVHQLFQTNWITWTYFLTLAPLGLLAWAYRKRYKAFIKRRSWKTWNEKNKEESNQLLSQRKEILEELIHKILSGKKLIT